MDLQTISAEDVKSENMNFNFTMEWYLGIFLILSIFILMLVEIGLCFITNIPFSNNPTKRGDEEDIGPESRIYNERALVFSGLTFAGITLLIDSSSNDLNQIQASLIVLTYSMSLFFISYKIEVLTGLKGIYWIIQEKTLNYGFIAIIVSLVIFFHAKIQSLFFIGIFLLVIVYMTHLMELKTDLEYYNDNKE